LVELWVGHSVALLVGNWAWSWVVSVVAGWDLKMAFRKAALMDALWALGSLG
jgi:hypothetical protein